MSTPVLATRLIVPGRRPVVIRTIRRR